MTYRKGGRLCGLCTAEKIHIMDNIQNPEYLNRRTELAQKCRHKAKFKLSNIRWPQQTTEGRGGGVHTYYTSLSRKDTFLQEGCTTTTLGQPTTVLTVSTTPNNTIDYYTRQNEDERRESKTVQTFHQKTAPSKKRSSWINNYKVRYEYLAAPALFGTIS